MIPVNEPALGPAELALVTEAILAGQISSAGAGRSDWIFVFSSELFYCFFCAMAYTSPKPIPAAQKLKPINLHDRLQSINS